MITKTYEKKWQDKWHEAGCFYAKNDSSKEKYYILVEFPYPSGTGLHVGHVRSYSALDAMARKKRLEGKNVLFPIGWDAFGLPAEQYAIKNHIHPSKAVLENIETFKGQLQKLGISFDWKREFSTTDPDYYKWTQWQFLKFYEHGLAYKAKKEINWCASCKIGLSNEEAEGGVCERCGSPVVKKEKEQWILKMSEYADKLIEGLNETEFLDRIKNAQINWIGKSQGALVNFKIKDTDDVLEVFTTRPDTLYGVTFMCMSPEHDYIKKYESIIKNIDEVKKYQVASAQKSEIERTDGTKEKTGVKLDGLKAINPVTNKEIEIWISDYVLKGYGTGAIMAVPAHDERDFAFAKKYNIEILPVIEGGDISKEAYTGDGKMINSGILNGLDNKKDSIEKMISYLEENNIGQRKTNYRLQDWIFSRQRFWGEPIPMIKCEKCGWVAVPEKELPLVLPEVVSYEPTDTGESPLANIDDWVNTTCPKCGQKAQRETDTMPNWAGSSWYFLRYMDAHNDKEFVSKDALNYWGAVDYYNGGMEHATRHLLYARFWNQFLHDIGLVPNSEPFKKRVAHGMVLASDGTKISKSKNNGINPLDVINEYGADTLRLYEMFMGDYEKEVAWSNEGLKGSRKFLDRVERLKDKVVDKDVFTDEFESIINKTIKKVTSDLDTMKYNTAVSALMILTNAYEKASEITKKDYHILLTLLYPIAPHLAEELNEKIGYDMIALSSWPVYDDAKCVDNTVEIGVQINGKLRGSIVTVMGETNEEILEKAKNNENVKKYLEGKDIIKTIVIPGKIVNIVIKG